VLGAQQSQGIHAPSRGRRASGVKTGEVPQLPAPSSGGIVGVASVHLRLIRPNGRSHSHTVCCTPHRHRKGGR
jgi:hypothetical protein